MKVRSFWCAFALLSSLPMLAQAHGGGRGSGTLPGTAPISNAPDNLGVSTAAFISGKVTIDDSSDLIDSAAIQLTCRGQRHTVTYTDRRGNFSFQFGDATSTAEGDVGDASSSITTRAGGAQEERNWRDCEVQASLAGYTSEMVELASRMSSIESVDLGRIALHRMEHVEGTSISVTTALAPATAKKAFEKARDLEKKAKFDEAEQSLQKAIRIYPRFAIAWNELGKLQLQKNDTTAATNSFQQAVAADARYVDPYDGLASLAFQANQWAQVVEVTNKLLSLNPVNFPQAYFYNGAANYYLENIAAAEKITRQGIRVDDGHQVPKLQYLLGVILIRKQEYQQASQQMQEFLKFAKQPADIDRAKKQLAEIARLAANSNPPPTDDGKK
jgi:tetratricopeptide (TPR) repeat protein